MTPIKYKVCLMNATIVGLLSFYGGIVVPMGLSVCFLATQLTIDLLSGACIELLKNNHILSKMEKINTKMSLVSHESYVVYLPIP